MACPAQESMRVSRVSYVRTRRLANQGVFSSANGQKRYDP
ncbi:uncharacterized protein METZ01_LOCUS153549 [marine metagenome]|uniref:Uncharacterized protein n=1 Tax=marine metagenome TaxID=408172 RepID=A0A382AGI2_9ZZZZ